MTNEQLPQPDPAAIARPLAEALAVDGYLDTSEQTEFEQSQLASLHEIAEKLEMIDQSYFVTSGKALLLPVKRSNDD